MSTIFHVPIWCVSHETEKTIRIVISSDNLFYLSSSMVHIGILSLNDKPLGDNIKPMISFQKYKNIL